MKKLVFILLFFISLFSKAQVTFQKTFGGNTTESGKYINTCTDGFIITGWTGLGAGIADVYLVKIDTSGNLLWTKTFGGGDPDVGNYVQQTSDGGFIIAGSTSSYPFAVFPNIYVLKTDSNGNKQWDNTYGGTEWGEAYSLAETSDGGYMICGFTKTYGSGDKDIYLVKIDSSGNYQWGKAYGGNGPDIGKRIIKRPDGSFLISGTIRSNIGLDMPYLMNVDSLGDTIWTKTYNNGGGTGNNIQPINDGNYIIVGSAYMSLDVDVFLLKVDASGTPLWGKSYGGSSYNEGWAVRQTTDYGYILLGTTSNSPGLYDIRLIKTDSSGNFLWNKVLDLSNDDRSGYSIIQTADNGYLFPAKSFMSNTNNMLIVKTDINGSSLCNETFAPIVTSNPGIFIEGTLPNILLGGNDAPPFILLGTGGTETIICMTTQPELKDESQLKISPNPFSTNATVEMNGYQSSVIGSQFILYDVFGREVKSFQVKSQKFEIERGNLASGIYFYKLSSSTEVLGTGKVVLE